MIKKFNLNIFLSNIFILVFAILAGFLIYYYAVGKVLINNCLLDSSNCAKIKYKQLRNTVLIELPNYYWVWFNGAELFVYGYPTSKECTEGHDVAFIINSEDLALKGFQCAISLNRLFEMYKDIDYKYYFLSTLPCKNETNPALCDTHIACMEKSKCVDDEHNCAAGSGCHVTTFGAVDIINIFLQEGIIQKTHMVTKTYSQENPHPPTAPTAPVSNTCN